MTSPGTHTGIFRYLCPNMKKFLEKVLNISLLFGGIAVILNLFVMSSPVFMLAALSAGFFGFVMGCLHIVGVQRYEIKQGPVSLLLLTLLLNSIPLIYMMIVVSRAAHS